MGDRPSHWSTADVHKNAALRSAASIEALAAQHTWLVAENATLRDQLRGAVEALRRIKAEEGKVCDQFEVCNHRACNSSYTAWAIADEYLRAAHASTTLHHDHEGTT